MIGRRPLCGTRDGLAWHLMQGEPVCEECAAGSQRRAMLARLETERVTPQPASVVADIDRKLGQLIQLLDRLLTEETA